MRFTNFAHSHAPTLAGAMFVEAGLRHRIFMNILPCYGSYTYVSKLGRAIATSIVFSGTMGTRSQEGDFQARSSMNNSSPMS